MSKETAAVELKDAVTIVASKLGVDARVLFSALSIELYFQRERTKTARRVREEREARRQTQLSCSHEHVGGSSHLVFVETTQPGQPSSGYLLCQKNQCIIKKDDPSFVKLLSSITSFGYGDSESESRKQPRKPLKISKKEQRAYSMPLPELRLLADKQLKKGL